MSETRQVQTLDIDYNEEKHADALKNDKLSLYENEYELMKGSLNFPTQFMSLDELSQKIVMLSIDKDYVEPYSERKTENNPFISFLASYPNKKVVSMIWKSIQVSAGFNKDGDELFTYKKVPNDANIDLYYKLKNHATLLWRNNKLKDIAKSMKEIVTYGGYKVDELLEEKIIDDALSNDRDTYTMQNRKLAVDIKGMKKERGLQVINVFEKGGGKELNQVIIDSTGNKVYDLVPKDILDAVVEEK